MLYLRRRGERHGRELELAVLSEDMRRESSTAMIRDGCMEDHGRQLRCWVEQTMRGLRTHMGVSCWGDGLTRDTR